MEVWYRFNPLSQSQPVHSRVRGETHTSAVTCTCVCEGLHTRVQVEIAMHIPYLVVTYSACNTARQYIKLNAACIANAC